MANYREQRTPYEFLVRWNPDGTISGAHISWLDTLYKDDEILTQSPTPVESVAIAEQEGYPLNDVLSQVLLDALKELEKNKLK
jgi:hypothetical protein